MRKKLANQAGALTGWEGDAEGLLVALRNSKADLKHATAMVGDYQPRLVKIMQDHDMRKVQVADEEGVTVTGTKVEPSVVEIDEGRLAKALGARDWSKVTTPKLDKVKLEQMIAAGVVDPWVVASCSTEVNRTPYVLVKESNPTKARS